MKCKYYKKHLDTIRKMIDLLYSLENCQSGGCLHLLLDDYNVDDDDIKFCLKQCGDNPEKEEAELGKAICYEFLKLNRNERYLIFYGDNNFNCCNEQDCYCCGIEYDDDILNAHIWERGQSNK